MQGNELLDEWITSYYIAFSDDGINFNRYKTPSGDDEVLLQKSYCSCKNFKGCIIVAEKDIFFGNMFVIFDLAT